MDADTLITFDDVMFDWAKAEVLSPVFWPRWYHPLGDALRDRVRTGRLLLNDRSTLIDALLQVRGPYLISPFGISCTSKFSQRTASRAEIAELRILDMFASKYGRITFGEFAARILNQPRPDEIPMGAAVLEMVDFVQHGGSLSGNPIAVADETSLPLRLIEGYKRCMVAMHLGVAIKLFVCDP